MWISLPSVYFTPQPPAFVLGLSDNRPCRPICACGRLQGLMAAKRANIICNNKLQCVSPGNGWQYENAANVSLSI